MRKSCLRNDLLAVVAAIFILALSSAPAAAQSDTVPWRGYTDEQHRNDCRLAHQVLTLGQPAVKREWALGPDPVRILEP